MAPSEGPKSPVLSLSPQKPVQTPNELHVLSTMNFDQSNRSNAQQDPASPTSSPERPSAQGDFESSIEQQSSKQHSKSPTKPPHQCSNCLSFAQQHHSLERRVARLRLRLHDSIETAQTHGQRLLRAAFQEKLREMTAEHAHRTTEMLNVQKKCFEDELELMETETQSTIHALQNELSDQRHETDKLVFRYERERDDTLEKTQSTMQAVQRKLAHIQGRSSRLERENNQLVAAHEQKQLMIEVLASTAAARDVERRRLVVLENGQEEERKRKNSLIDSLQAEIAVLRKQLEVQVEENRNMSSKVSRLEKELQEESQRHSEQVEDLKQESNSEIDRMGRLFANMIEDFAQLPSDTATTD